MLFQVLAGLLALITALVLIRPLIFGGASAETRESREARLYRDQLDEIGRDRERGTIDAGEAEGARAEVSRRLIAASSRAEAAPQHEPAPRRYSRLLAGLALLGAPALAAGLYLSNGAPGLPDLPFAGRTLQGPASADAGRPTQAEAEAAFAPDPAETVNAAQEEYAELIADLETVVAARPSDIDGRRLLASGYMRLRRHAEAWRAFESLIVLMGESAGPELLAVQTEAMVLAAGGYISPEAERVLGLAMALDPSLPMTRYFSGLLLAQYGRVDEAMAIWRQLRAEAPGNTPWLEFLDQMLSEAEAPGDALPGPDATDVAGAKAMSPLDRQAMIEGMVARLESRLTSDGGAVEEWHRLIASYMQLDRPGDARRIFVLGTAAFGDGAEAGYLREQALLMGVIAE